MQLEALPLTGACRIVLQPKSDERGFFARRFCADTFASHGLKTDFVQRSVSYNARRGTLRGLHFQARPHAETKIVRCTRGAAFDVIVDLRPTSSTFGHWHAEILSADNHIALYIPEGFAHGFQTLCSDCEMLYFHTAPYAAEAEDAVNMLDPAFGIEWPLAITERSARDEGHPFITSAFESLKT